MKTIRVSGSGFAGFLQTGRCNLEFPACNTFAQDAQRDDVFELKNRDGEGSAIVAVIDKKERPDNKIELAVARAGGMA